MNFLKYCMCVCGVVNTCDSLISKRIGPIAIWKLFELESLSHQKPFVIMKKLLVSVYSRCKEISLTQCLSSVGRECLFPWGSAEWQRHKQDKLGLRAHSFTCCRILFCQSLRFFSIPRTGQRSEMTISPSSHKWAKCIQPHSTPCWIHKEFIAKSSWGVEHSIFVESEMRTGRPGSGLQEFLHFFYSPVSFNLTMNTNK